MDCIDGAAFNFFMKKFKNLLTLCPPPEIVQLHTVTKINNMSTKTLLAAAALIAAGVASSMAQSNVYSLNIVGYYNVPVSGALTPLANSLRADTGGAVDRLDKVIPYADGDNIQVWNGAGWDLWTMDSISATGYVNPQGNDAPLASLPVLGPGVGFFYGKNTGTTNVTFVGEVRTGTNTIVIPAGLKPIGSPLPVGGAVSTGAPTLAVQDGDNIQLWTGAGWALHARDSISSTGWVAPNGSDGPEPTLKVGEGFFYGNNVGTFNWVQILNP